MGRGGVINSNVNVVNALGDMINYVKHHPNGNQYHQSNRVHGASGPRPPEGPSGANLFIYHIPHNMTNTNLTRAFPPFGDVVSAMLYVDCTTGKSKSFGFVSYGDVD